MSISTRFFGLILFVGGLLLLATNSKNLKVQYDGYLVNMQIVDLPASCLGTKTNHFVSLLYEGTVFKKKIGGKYCDEHHIGEIVEMKYLDGIDLILFPDESVSQNLIAFVIISLVGLVTVIVGFRRK